MKKHRQKHPARFAIRSGNKNKRRPKWKKIIIKACQHLKIIKQQQPSRIMLQIPYNPIKPLSRVTRGAQKSCPHPAFSFFINKRYSNPQPQDYNSEHLPLSIGSCLSCVLLLGH